MGNDCSLCGGKIANGKCTLCGLDFTRMQRQYNLNRRIESDSQETAAEMRAADKPSQAEKPRQPQIHKTETVKTNTPPSKPQKSTPNRQVIYDKSGKVDKKPKNQSKIRTIVIVGAVILSFAVPMLEGIIERYQSVRYDSVTEEMTAVEEDRNWYEYTVAELPEGGEYCRLELEAGSYIAGKHIPVGRYKVTTEADYGWIQVVDAENKVFISEGMSSEEDGYFPNVLEDVRLFEGASVDVQCTGILEFESENGQTEELAVPQENPLDQEVDITEEAISGEDFEPGVYDVELVYGDLVLEIINEDNEYILGISMNETGFGIAHYKNLELAKGTRIFPANAAEEYHVRLIPSKEIYP